MSEYSNVRNVSRQSWVKKDCLGKTPETRVESREASPGRGGSDLRAGRWQPRAPRKTAPPAGEKGNSSDLAGGCAIATATGWTEPTFQSPLHSGCCRIYPHPTKLKVMGTTRAAFRSRRETYRTVMV